jgi:hypothetical protein
MFVENATTGSQSIVFRQAGGSGSTVTVPTGKTKLLYFDGSGSNANVVDISSLLTHASLDVDGNVDISGDLTLSAGADGALQFTNAGENSIKIPDNQASALIIEEADNAYMTFTTTNSSEKVTIAKDLEVSGTTTVDDITGHLSTQTSATGTVNASTFAGYQGKRVILTGSSATTYQLPDAVSGDVGKTWIILNASTASITIDRNTNSQTTNTLTGFGITTISSGTTNITLASGGVAEVVCTATDTYAVYGSGLS